MEKCYEHDGKLLIAGNGGSGTTAATAGKVDQEVEVAENGFSKTGYTFSGWNTAADGSGDAYAAGNTYKLTAGEDKLYAQWTANTYTVKFDKNANQTLPISKDPEYFLLYL